MFGLISLDPRDSFQTPEPAHRWAASSSGLAGLPNAFTSRNAKVWGKLLGKEITYTGHDFDRWEQTMRGQMPAWMAFDLRMMFQGYFDRGFASTETEVARISRLLGHAPRSYEDFAAETTDLWKA